MQQQNQSDTVAQLQDELKRANDILATNQRALDAIHTHDAPNIEKALAASEAARTHYHQWGFFVIKALRDAKYDEVADRIYLKMPCSFGPLERFCRRHYNQMYWEGVREWLVRLTKKLADATGRDEKTVRNEVMGELIAESLALDVDFEPALLVQQLALEEQERDKAQSELALLQAAVLACTEEVFHGQGNFNDRVNRELPRLSETARIGKAYHAGPTTMDVLAQLQNSAYCNVRSWRNSGFDYMAWGELGWKPWSNREALPSPQDIPLEYGVAERAFVEQWLRENDNGDRTPLDALHSQIVPEHFWHGCKGRGGPRSGYGVSEIYNVLCYLVTCDYATKENQ